MANQTCCEIKVHYQDRDGSFDTHLLSPDSCKRGVIELAFLKSHYDLVIKRIVKKEPTMTNDPTLSFAHDSDSESSEIGDMSNCDARTEEHMTPDPFIKKHGLQMRRSDGKIYVNDSVWEDMLPIKVTTLPYDIDGNSIYQLPFDKEDRFKNTKDGRPWGHTSQDFSGSVSCQTAKVGLFT